MDRGGQGRFVVRRALPQDLPDVVRICRESPQAPQWAASFFAGLLAPQDSEGLRRVLHVAVREGVIAGFSVASAICSVFPADAELESIAVDPALRGAGAGRALLHACGVWAAAQGAEQLRLEVRLSNDAALRLYAANGFSRTGTRRGYYSHPDEDAVLMERGLHYDPAETAAHRLA